MKKELFFIVGMLFGVCCSAMHAAQKDNNTKKCNVVIMLHLYHLNLLEEFVERINKCITRNPAYNFFVKINIPIDKNVEELVAATQSTEIRLARQDVVQLAPYHPNLITDKNGHVLQALARDIEQRFLTAPGTVQVIFAENRGMDIGGFFLLLDQTFKQKTPCDYFIKLHSKADTEWRNRLLGILDLDFNKYMPQYDSIYACKHMSHDADPVEEITRKILKKILKKFNLPEKKSFPFCAGTMFVAPRKMADFFGKHDLVQLYNGLELGYTRAIIDEHAYERFFGYLEKHLKIKTYYCDSYVS